MEFEMLANVIAAELGVDAKEITMETTFEKDLAADSLDVVAIIMNLEEQLKIEIPEEEASEIKTVGDAVEKIKKARALS